MSSAISMKLSVKPLHVVMCDFDYKRNLHILILQDSLQSTLLRCFTLDVVWLSTGCMYTHVYIFIQKYEHFQAQKNRKNKIRNFFQTFGISTRPHGTHPRRGRSWQTSQWWPQTSRTLWGYFPSLTFISGKTSLKLSLRSYYKLFQQVLITLMVEPRFRFQSSALRLRSGYSRAVKGFSHGTSVSPLQLSFHQSSIISSIIRGF